ncbi:porin [Shewanella sp. D64]|uniref:porin n=1 Tax=unclassified Shewanella TaxID=196818 RepID=UPI0022BA471E|nr:MULTISPECIES: porin [unclassified Shewanella]MEC4726624.1 porin [Shewanella sp. D64]MEC4739012.1 porin [Shewanella sp. E94]WBJ96841.1 porin [Shewanella sp. MTB7]
MNKSFIATAIAVLIVSPSISATELYKDAKNQLTLGGYGDFSVLNTNDTTEVVNNASRINFQFSHKLSNGLKAFSTMEWGINPFDSTLVYNRESLFSSQNGDLLNSRLAFIGLSYNQYGSLSFGKQWSAWYDVVGGTDNAFIWGGAAAGEYSLDGSGGIDGVGRADKAIQYRNTIGNFSFTLQTQLQDNTIDLTGFDQVDPDGTSTLTYGNTYGASATYDFSDKLSVSVGGNRGEFKGFNSTTNDSIDTEDEIYGASVSWGTLSGDGLYVSANYNKNKYHETDNSGRLIPDADGVEAMVSYYSDNVRSYLIYNTLSADNYSFMGNDGILQNVTEYNEQSLVPGIAYIWDSTLVTYIEGKIDMSDFVTNGVKSEGDSAVAVGIRYYL